MSPVLSKKDGHFAKKCWITVLFFYVRVPSFHVVDGFKGGQTSEGIFIFVPYSGIKFKIKSVSTSFFYLAIKWIGSDFIFLKVGHKWK